MKKMLMALMMGAALCGAAEYRIEAMGMDSEDEGWLKHCSGTQGSMREASKKGIKLNGSYALDAGDYYIWVRTGTNNENWRKGQLKINGASFGKFGDEKQKGYTKPVLAWKKAVLPLKVTEAGKLNKFEFTALNYCFRFDCIVLSTDPNFKPSDDNAAIEEIEELDNAE